MGEPVVFTPVMQLDTWDCGVACLQMLLGVSYVDVRKQIRYKNPTGLTHREMLGIAKRLGHPLITRKNVMAEDVGILLIQRPSGDTKTVEGHYVIIAKGVLYNPAQGQMWTEPEAYVKTGGWEVVGILKRKEAEHDGINGE